jgi:hypothetical protein
MVTETPTGDLLQEARRRRPQDHIELIGFLLELILRTGRLARQLRGHALIQQSIDDLLGEFQPRVGREAWYRLIQYGLWTKLSLTVSTFSGQSGPRPWMPQLADSEPSVHSRAAAVHCDDNTP